MNFGGAVILLDIQWIIGGYNVPILLCYNRDFDDYYGMEVSHKSQKHKTLTHHNDS